MNKLLISAITKKGFEEKLSRGEVSQYLVAFIQETKEIWALGIYYPCPYTKKEILDFIKTLMDEDNKIYGVIDTKEEQLTNLISLEFVRATAKERSLEQLINKNYADLQESKVNKDSTIPIKAVSFIGNLDGLYINKLTDYIKATTVDSIKTTDSLNIALGKLEHKTDIIYNDLFGEDNDKIINKWEEIVDFISSVEEGKDITDEFITRKTDLVITGNKTFEGIGAGLVTINRTSGATPWVCFKDRNNIVGYLGVSSESIPTFNDTTASHNLLHAGNYSNYALPLTGGILNSGTDTPLFIKGTNHSCIGFKNSEGTTLGYIGAKQNKQPYFYIGNDAFKIYHEGNDGHLSGLDADTVDGVHSSDLFVSPNYWQALGDFNDVDQQGFYAISGANVSNCPVIFGNLILFYNSYSPTYSSAQIVVDAEKHNLQFRHKWDNVWSKWKTIAFTDSDITGNAATATTSKYLKTSVSKGQVDANNLSNNAGLVTYNSYISNNSLHLPIFNGYLNGVLSLGLHENGVTAQFYMSKDNPLYYRSNVINDWKQIATTDSNVASATKLATPVKLWGNDFDGSSSISKSLNIENNNAINFKDNKGNNVNSIGVNSFNLLSFGYGAILNGYDSLFFGKNLKFFNNDGATCVMIINSESNVGIGTNSPRTKLHIEEGNFLIHRETGSPLVKIEKGDLGVSFLIDSFKGLYDHNNSKWIIGSTTAGNTLLNCGNVGIGTDNPIRKFVISDSGKNGIEISPYSSDNTIITYNRETGEYTPFTVQCSSFGIGTNNPSSKLHVIGSIYSSSTVTANLFSSANNSGYNNIDNAGNSLNILILDKNNNLIMGLGTAGSNISTYIDGNAVHLRYSAYHLSGLILNESGNVTIGNSNLASDKYRLYVDGLLHTNSLSIQSDTKVDNLNADKLDGYEAEDFALKSDVMTGYANGVYAVRADESLCTIDEADTSCIGVALIQGEHKFMIAKNNATDGTNSTLHWGKNLYGKDVTDVVNTSTADGNYSYGYLPKPDGTFEDSKHLSNDFTTWTVGALSEFNGKANTAAIINGYTEHDVSMDTRDMCTVLNTFNTSDNHNDWYVPACGQLALIYLNKTEINAALAKIGGTKFASSEYWTSSEYGSHNGWYVDFNLGKVYSPNKSGYIRVRFIRDIQIESPKSVKDVLIEIVSKVNNLESQIGDINSILKSIINGSPNIITFTIDNIEYQAEEGMTWEEWVDSDYCNNEDWLRIWVGDSLDGKSKILIMYKSNTGAYFYLSLDEEGNNIVDASQVINKNNAYYFWESNEE